MQHMGGGENDAQSIVGVGRRNMCPRKGVQGEEALSRAGGKEGEFQSYAKEVENSGCNGKAKQRSQSHRQGGHL